MHVDCNLFTSPQAYNTLVLKEAKQFDLERRRQFTDFVQKKNPALCRFDPSLSLHVSAGKKGSALMAEELSFQEVFRNRIRS